MTRGNQRENDRKKGQARNEANKKKEHVAGFTLTLSLKAY